jgi:cold shock CspA family protein
VKGRITAIKRAKFFGFIRDEQGVDRFFHANACDTLFDQLQEGLDVTFEPYDEPGRGTKGHRARRVKVTP